MSNTELVLIDILRSFASENAEKPHIDKVDAEELFILAKKHSVIGIVAYILDKYGLFDDAEQSKKFMHEYDRTVMNMLSRETSALRLSQKLRELSVRHILFKGMIVASAYPVPALRTYGDADILIHKEDVKPVCDYMISQGYSHSVADAGVVNSFVRNKEHYEFHTNLNVSNLKNSDYFSVIWENALGDDLCLTFDHNFHLSYLITHLEKHVYGSGAGLRMYLDIVLYIQKYREHIDLDKVRSNLSQCGLGCFLNTVLYVCHKWFGLVVPSWVVPLDDEVLSQLYRFTLDGGVFGDKSEKKLEEDALRRSMEDGKKNARLRFLLRHIFPPFSELSRLYPKYRGKPYLAPVAWINHIVRFFTAKKYNRVKVIASANMENAESKKKFLESIGSVR